MRWDPKQYALFGAERSRPFYELVAQIGADSPASVADLGCGPGPLTVTLANRWPNASILGIDSSPEMIEAAQAHVGPQVSFRLGKAEDFSAKGFDVVVGNAVLQWVPRHLSLLARWAEELNSRGWLAFQVPSIFGRESHVLLRELAESARWRDRLRSSFPYEGTVATPAEYLDVLATAGMRVNVWQTEYLHVLSGDDAVLEWLRGTALRPVLGLLSNDERVEFETEYGARLRKAYPKRPYGTVFPFLRTFVVGSK